MFSANFVGVDQSTYTYDAHRRLASTTNTATGETTTIVYDGDGLRSTITTPTTTTPMTWDRVGQLPEIISDGTTAYVHLPGQTISDDTATSIGLVDPLGSVRYQTDPAGTTTHTLSYTPYGQLVSGTPLTRFGYTGEWTDPGGQLYLRARVYQPSTGRFLTRDPIQPNHPGTQGWNHYTYTTNLTDPSGLVPLAENALLRSALVGGAKGAAFGLASGLATGFAVCDPAQPSFLTCILNTTLIGGVTGGIFGVPAGILAGAAAEAGLIAVGVGFWALAAFSVVAACLGGAVIGEKQDQIFSDIVGKDPDPEISRAVGCVGGSIGFGGGAGLFPFPSPAAATSSP